MDIRAHNILSAVIAEQGMQLAASDAYCQVYLAGHMTDYPKEKQTLVALKKLELPDALLDFNSTLLSESELCTFILKLCAHPQVDKDSVAWGVDAWAAALDVSEAVRREIRKQCFSDVSQRLNTDPEYLEVEKLISNLDTTQPEPKAQSLLGKTFKTATFSIIALVTLTVFGAHSLDTLNLDPHPVVLSGEEPRQILSEAPPLPVVRADEMVVLAPKLELQAPLAIDPLNILEDPTISVENASADSVESLRSDFFVASVPETLDESERSRPSLTNLMPLIIQENKTKKNDFKVVQNEPVKTKAHQRVSKAPVSVFNPKTKQLNADIESFLINGN